MDLFGVPSGTWFYTFFVPLWQLLFGMTKGRTKQPALFLFTFEARLTFLVELKKNNNVLSEINGQTIYMEMVDHVCKRLLSLRWKR